MSLYQELANRFISDLTKGVLSRRKDNHGAWYQVEIPYNTILKWYCTNTVPRNVFLSIYKTVPKIETIPANEKKEWKKFVNEIFPNTSPEFRLDAVKIIYTIGVLTNQN